MLFRRFFFEKFLLLDIIFLIFSHLQKLRLNKIFSVSIAFFQLQHRFRPYTLYINGSKEGVGPLTTAQTLGTTPVTPDHTPGFARLTSEMGILGLIVLTPRISLHPLHLTLGTAYRTRLRGTRTEEQNEHNQEGDQVFKFLHGSLYFERKDKFFPAKEYDFQEKCVSLSL